MEVVLFFSANILYLICCDGSCTANGCDGCMKLIIFMQHSSYSTVAITVIQETAQGS